MPAGTRGLRDFGGFIDGLPEECGAAVLSHVEERAAAVIKARSIYQILFGQWNQE